NIFAVGPACTVRVIPPPDEGRPESYSGAIGSNLTVKTSLDTASCNLGDPLTLTLTVSGQVKLDKMFPPKLSLQTNLLERFTLYDNTVQSVKKGNYNQYLYTIRPTQAGECNIPPIEVAYYDVVSRSYKKVFTAPIPLQVRRGAEVTEAQIIGSTNQLIPKKDETDLREKTPAPIRTSDAGARPASLLGNSRIVALAGAGPALYFAVVLLGFIGRSGRKIKRSRHIHSAKDRAGKCLKAAARIDRKDWPQAVALICKAARKYLGERLNRETNAITPPETVCILIENGVSKELAEKFGAIYEKYFNAGFTNSRFPGNLPDDCHALQGLIRHIEFELGRRRRPKGSGRRRCLPIIIFLLCVLSGWNVFALDVPERVFIWNEANAIVQTAKTPADYLRAVLVYQRLVDDGVRNGPLFYNIGTALLLADRNEQAGDAFERAERYLGRQPDIELNLRIASAKKAKSRHEQLPWYRIAAFWHFYLSCPQRIYIAAWAFLAFWLALTLKLSDPGYAGRRRSVAALCRAAKAEGFAEARVHASGLVLRKMGIKRITNAIVLISLVVFIVFATSAVASWQMEASAGRYNLPFQPSPASTNAPVRVVANN
ncbi:MAG: BatD family protein, partial [Kiritimatiellia bacterium]|nr:BatD family protein [Kiritimatiellia bacterium]